MANHLIKYLQQFLIGRRQCRIQDAFYIPTDKCHQNQYGVKSKYIEICWKRRKIFKYVEQVERGTNMVTKSR